MPLTGLFPAVLTESRGGSKSAFPRQAKDENCEENEPNNTIFDRCL